MWHSWGSVPPSQLEWPLPATSLSSGTSTLEVLRHCWYVGPFLILGVGRHFHSSGVMGKRSAGRLLLLFFQCLDNRCNHRLRYESQLSGLIKRTVTHFWLFLVLWNAGRTYVWSGWPTSRTRWHTQVHSKNEILRELVKFPIKNGHFLLQAYAAYLCFVRLFRTL